MTSQLEKSPTNYWNEKDKTNATQIKPIRKLKPQKKSQESKNSGPEMKIEDVFMNSEYLKLHSGNMSALSFCSGDNGENQWTLHPPPHPSANKKPFSSASRTRPNFIVDELTKSESAITEEEKNKSKNLLKNLKKQMAKENWEEQKETSCENNLIPKENFDKDLVSLITEQMFSAERELQITRNHLIETVNKLNQRDFEIIQLREKIRILQNGNNAETNLANDKKKTENDNAAKNYDDYQKLITASEKLKKQVKDMEEFLRDYGLTWVGDKEVNRRPDFDGIIKAFQRLNAMASQPKIIQTTLGAKFEVPRGIPIVFYSNGFLLREKDFREFGEVSTSLFLQDVEDGYFPSELQIEYPEGVPFEIFDKRNEVYKSSTTKTQVFQGNGNRLGSVFDGKQTSVVYLQPLKSNIKPESISSNTSKYEKSYPKKFQKKSTLTFTSQLQSAQVFGKQNSEIQKLIRNYTAEEELDEDESRINVKIRYASSETETEVFILPIPENKKMATFQKVLQEKLCEKFHEQCLVDWTTNNRPTDFEIHVYGLSPFRLSENCDKYPRDCGISQNCVINVTEI